MKLVDLCINLMAVMVISSVSERKGPHLAWFCLKKMTAVVGTESGDVGLFELCNPHLLATDLLQVISWMRP